MASSPSGRRSIYPSRDYPGCMGGIVHLFDFNQALSGKKLLTDKKFGESLEAPRKSFDVGNSIPEVLKSTSGRSEEISYGYEFRKACGSKKSSGMPMKALIAQELSKEPEPRNRAPSVVARLMGLDALPAESNAVQKASKSSVDEKPVLKSPLERRYREDLPPHDVKPYTKNSPSVHRLPDLYVSKSSRSQEIDWEDDRASFESLPFRNHPQEQQLREFKREFEARQSRKLDHPRSATLEDLDSQLSAKHMVVREKLREAKLALSQENCANSKRNAPQERVHESKEFLDAMDFLQSNKEFFIRFLQEPNSVFARDLQDNQVDFVSTESAPTAKHRRSHRIPDSCGSRSEEYVPQVWEKVSPESRRKFRSEQHFPKSLGADLRMERNLKSSIAPSFVDDISLGLSDRQMHTSSPSSTDNRARNADCHVPTRIVVLKPSPGRARNLKSLSSDHLESPKDYADEKDVIREDSKYVLQELRDRLRKDSREIYKQERKSNRPSTNEHYRDMTKDPREIAREIARQVRENVSREFMVNSGHLRSTGGTSSGSRTQSSRLASEEGDMAGSSDGEGCAPPRRLYWNHYKGSNQTMSHRTKNVDAETVHGSREGRRAAERSRLKNAEHADKSNFQSQSSTLRKVIYCEDSRHSSPGSKSSRSSRASGQHGIDGINASQNQQRTLFHKDSDRDDDVLRIEALESEVSPSSRNGEERSLRSKPTAMIAAAIDESREELLTKVPFREISEVGFEKVVDTTEVHIRRSTGAAILKTETSTRSIFSRKHSKSSFSLGNKKQAVRKEHIEPLSLPSEESAIEEDPSTTNERDQCQIEDTGPVLDNEDSVSSLENFSSLEAGITLEESLEVDGLVIQQIEIGSPDGKTSSESFLEPEDQENKLQCEEQCNECIASKKDSNNGVHSLSASPERLSYLANDAPTGANTESTKEECEQPSPVSVLDVPFQEETASPMDFKEISSDLQELRRRLQLLKVEDHEPEQDLETMQDEGYVGTDENHCKDNDCNLLIADSQIDLKYVNFVTDEMDCPFGKEMEMLYVKNVLVTAGFTGDSSAIFRAWHAPCQPLDPCLFQKMEGSYSWKESENQVCAEINVEADKQWGGLSDSSIRHLLFDRVNEGLFETLGPYLNLRQWLHPSKLPLRPMPRGKDLVKHVWTDVCLLSCVQSEAQDTLDSLVTKDLAKAGNWFDLWTDTETVGLEVEMAIFNDLIEETLLVL